MKITELQRLASLVDRSVPRIKNHSDHQSSTSHRVIHEAREEEASPEEQGTGQYANDQTPYTISFGKTSGRRSKNSAITSINEKISTVNLLAVELQQLADSWELQARDNAPRPSDSAFSARSKQIFSKLAELLQSTGAALPVDTKSNSPAAMQDHQKELLNGVRSKLLLALHQMMHERASAFNWSETVEIRDEAQAVAYELKQQLPVYREEAIYGSANQDPQLVYELLRS